MQISVRFYRNRILHLLGDIGEVISKITKTDFNKKLKWFTMAVTQGTKDNFGGLLIGLNDKNESFIFHDSIYAVKRNLTRSIEIPKSIANNISIVDTNSSFSVVSVGFAANILFHTTTGLKPISRVISMEIRANGMDNLIDPVVIISHTEQSSKKAKMCGWYDFRKSGKLQVILLTA